MNQDTRPRGHRLTLRDLARHAGVSPATVSLVLRRSPLVKEATRQRVQASIAALGYIYNHGAASLRTRRTNTVGIAINELANPYFADLTAALERALTAVGRTAFLANSQEDPQRQVDFIRKMAEYNADGVVLCPANLTDTAELLRALRETGLPCVLISRDLPGSGLDYAGHDHRRGMRLAVEHLIALGHSRIAMIGAGESWTAQERRRGYMDALNAHEIPADPALLIACPPTRSAGAEAIRHLLALRDAPTAAACFNDVLAFGVMLGLRRLGCEPGQDFAVTGNDDVVEAALWTPGLTTTAIDSAAIGDAAAGLLLARIEAPESPPRRIVLAPRLAVRGSSAPVPGYARCAAATAAGP